MGIVRDQSVKNSVYFYFGLFFGALSTIIFYPNAFNTHPEHLGLLQIIVAYSSIVSTSSSLGAPKMLIRFFPKVTNKNQLVTLSFLIPTIGFLLLCLFYFLFKESILDFFRPLDADFDIAQDFQSEMSTYNLLSRNFHLIFLLVASLSFFEVLSSLSRCLLKATIPIFLREIFLKGMTIFLLFLHWFFPSFMSFQLFLHLYILLYFLMTLFLCWTIFRGFSYSFTLRFNDIQIRKMIIFGIYVFIGGSSAIFVSKIDMMMIQSILGFKEVAFYTVAFFIGNVIRIPGRAVGAIASPLLAKALENRDQAEIKNIYVKSAINQLVLGGLIFLVVWLNITDGFNLLPEKFRNGEIVVLFIALSQLFNISTGVNGIIIVNSKYYRFDLYANVILAGLTLYTNWIFIPMYGINGAAFATALSLLIFNLMKMIFVYVKMGIHPFTNQTIKAIFLISLCYFLIGNIPLINNVDAEISISIVNCLIRCSLLVILYLPLLIWMKISQDINQMLIEIKKRYIS